MKRVLSIVFNCPFLAILIPEGMSLNLVKIHDLAHVFTTHAWKNMCQHITFNLLHSLMFDLSQLHIFVLLFRLELSSSYSHYS